MTQPPGEGLHHSSEALTAEQEAFLFGHPGPLDGGSLDSFGILTEKMKLRNEWLAQFWSDEILAEFVDRLADAEKFGEEDARKSGQVATFIPLPSSPIAFALDGEDFSDRRWQPIDSRPVLNTALLHAYNALETDPSRNEKLSYILALTQEYDDYGWGNSAKTTRDIIFPMPVAEYASSPFPTHLANTDLLW